MKYTTNYSLKKPDGTDVVNIDDFNANADTIDAELAKRALKTDIPTVPVQSVNSKTGAVVISKSDVGLGNVNNWGATTAVNSTSTTTYATASAVKQAYDKGVEALNKANEVEASSSKSSSINSLKYKSLSNSSYTFSTLIDVVNITGSGYLRTAIIAEDYRPRQLIITIDGVIVFGMNKTGSGDIGTDRGYGIITGGYSCAGDTTYIPIIGGNGVSTSSFTNNSYNIPHNRLYSFSATAGCLYDVKEYIRFEKSLRIQILGDYIAYGIEYYLD